MRTLILALVLVGCTKQVTTPPPQHAAPAASPGNAAVDYAHSLAADAQCMPLATAQDKQPDTAVCDFGQVLAYCRGQYAVAGGMVGFRADVSKCSPFADLRPKAPSSNSEGGDAAHAQAASSAAAAKSDDKQAVKSKVKPEPKKK